MARTYKSPFEDKTFKSVDELERHTKKYHSDKIPAEYHGDIDHYLFDHCNGFKGGRCQVCGAPTKWDPKTKRYEVLCEPISVRKIINDPYRTLKTYVDNKGNDCKTIARKNYLENIERRRGTSNLMADEEYQKMLLESKGKKVRYKDKEMIVVGSYEVLFVQECNKILIRNDDLESPGPTIPYYNPIKKKDTYTIWDFYIKSIDAIISIKDEGFNKITKAVEEKRIVDTAKFKKGLDTKYKCVIELNGKEEIRDFKRIYNEAKEYIEEGKRYIKYPNYYKEYENKI